MTEHEQRPPQRDRREYFRIDDSIRVNISPVPDDQLDRLEELLRQKANGAFTVMSSLAAISTEMAVNMRHIETSEPDIAAYLKALDRKIEVLGRAFVMQESDLVKQQVRPVNLSAGGMSMLTNEAYRPGQVMEIDMLLFPSLAGLVMYGAVIDCCRVEAGDVEPGYAWRTRLAFTCLREQDRDLLIKHILRCESNALRKRSLETQPGGESSHE